MLSNAHWIRGYNDGRRSIILVFPISSLCILDYSNAKIRAVKTIFAYFEDLEGEYYQES